jgi:hypothetical protein
MMIGMSCFVLSNPPSFVHLPAILHTNAADFVRGVLMGLSIGFNLLAVWMNGRNRSCAG